MTHQRVKQDMELRDLIRKLDEAAYIHGFSWGFSTTDVAGHNRGFDERTEARNELLDFLGQDGRGVFEDDFVLSQDTTPALGTIALIVRRNLTMICKAEKYGWEEIGSGPCRYMQGYDICDVLAVLYTPPSV